MKKKPTKSIQQTLVLARPGRAEEKGEKAHRACVQLKIIVVSRVMAIILGGVLFRCQGLKVKCIGTSVHARSKCLCTLFSAASFVNFVYFSICLPVCH